jgi:hypothetical protein
VETPEAPQEGIAVRLGRAAEERGLAVARWAGRGDEGRGFSKLALALAAAFFVVLFLPWIGFLSGWTLRTADDSGLLALAVVLVELLRLSGSWASHGARVAAVCLSAATGLMAMTTWVTLRTGNGPLGGSLCYGAWLGFVVALLLLALSALRLAVLRRPAS